MSNRGIAIYHEGKLVETVSVLSEFEIGEEWAVFVYDGGEISRTQLYSGGVLTVEGGTASDSYVLNQGIMEVNGGLVTAVVVFQGGDLKVQAKVEGIIVLSNGKVTVNSGGNAQGVNVFENGSVVVNADALLEDCILQNGSVELVGGTASHITMANGALTVEKGGIVTGIQQIRNGSAITVGNGGTAKTTSCHGASVTVSNGGIAVDTSVDGYQNGDLEYSGCLTLQAGAVHKGTLTVGNLGKVVAESGSVIDFTVSDCLPGDGLLVSRLDLLEGTPDFTLTVRSDQPTGNYRLAEHAGEFSQSIMLQDTAGNELGELTPGGELLTPDYLYTLNLVSGDLSLTIEENLPCPGELSGNADGLSWKSQAEQFDVALVRQDGAWEQSISVAGCEMDMYALPAGTYDWEVKNAHGSCWSAGEAFESAGPAISPDRYVSDGDGYADLFFANASGVWESGYQAKHVGNKSGWNGTGECVDLAGKACITDIFAGSSDASILACSVPEAQALGIALFLDDIYSASPVPEAQASGRLSQIDTILATDGDDIIDLTSQRFGVDGGVTVHGNGGDDIIWANSGANTLFGNDGNDHIIGGSGDDLLIGGAGDDTLHGGGGNDIFCFGEGWGNDTISQLTGKDDNVTLWFGQNNETLQLAFSTDSCDTLITAATGDTIRAIGILVTIDDCCFGKTGHEAEYTTLASTGVFA